MDNNVLKDFPIMDLNWKELHGRTLKMHCTTERSGVSLVVGVDVDTHDLFVLKEITEDV